MNGFIVLFIRAGGGGGYGPPKLFLATVLKHFRIRS